MIIHVMRKKKKTKKEVWNGWIYNLGKSDQRDLTGKVKFEYKDKVVVQQDEDRYR